MVFLHYTLWLLVAIKNVIQESFNFKINFTFLIILENLLPWLIRLLACVHCYPRLLWETPKNCSIASICQQKKSVKEGNEHDMLVTLVLFKIFITAFYDYTRSVVSAYSTGYVSKRGHGSYPSKNEPKWHEIHVKLWCHQKIKAGIIEPKPHWRSMP